MKFSGYFLVTIATVLVLFTQQSDAGLIDLIDDGIDAFKTAIRHERARSTIKYIETSSEDNEGSKAFPQANRILIDSYKNATNAVSESEDTIVEGFKEAQNLIEENPEGAKKVFQEAIAKCQTQFLSSGFYFFTTHGKALALSNEGAREKLSDGSKILQRVGLNLIDLCDITGDLFVKGVNNGGNATELALQSIPLAIDSIYKTTYSKIEESFDKSCEGLDDAESKPIYAQIENSNCETITSQDSAASGIMDEINEAAGNAIKRGANATLVNNYVKAIGCSIADIVNIANDGRDIEEDFGRTTEIDPSAALISSGQRIQSIKDRVHNCNAKVFMDLGDIVVKAGIESTDQIDAAITFLEHGNVQTFTGIKTVADTLEISSTYTGDTLKESIKSVVKIGFLAKQIIMQNIAAAEKIILDCMSQLRN